MSIRLLDSTRYSMASANETNDITARTWTHIKVLYILVILLSAVALALFIVCFMMVLEVQHDVNSEISLRKERENKFLRDIVVDLPLTGQSSSQQAEIFTKETKNTESLILAGNEVKLSASVLTKFCASIHAHCPVRGFPGAQGMPGESIKGDRGPIGVRGYPGPQGVPGHPAPKGAKGDIGAPGYGLRGPVGVKGEKGQIGNTGLRGFKGETGDAGLPGLGVKGDAGVKGQKGSTGLPGHDGINGLTGLKGQKGALGPPGMSGSPGAEGVAGSPGSTGAKGEEGPAGKPGAPGPTGPRGTRGCKGQKGERADLAIYGRMRNWFSCGVGFKGEKGAPGVAGLGAKGEKGSPGMASSGFGLKGEKGTPGIPGSPGRIGLMGLPGAPGAAGDPGAPGAAGVAGVPGAPGDTGRDGLPGPVGPPGKTGVDGLKGDKGAAATLTADLVKETIMRFNLTSSLKGEPGAKGEPGVAGLAGADGRRGKRGHKGDPGDVLQCDCLVGPPGEKGDPGVCPRPPPIHVLFQNTTIPEKKRDLTIKRIGKPVLFRRMDVNWGSWMVDSDPTVITKDKYYVTKHFTGRLVYEYSTAQFSLKSGNYSKVYNIQDHFYGTGGVVYRGSFYYNRAGLDIIARYDFNAKSITAQLPIQDSLHRGAENLFSTDYNVFDLAVDQNGLWVVYAFKDSVVEEAVSDLLLIAKLEPNYLDIEKAWNLTVNRKEYSNSFIAHGILYLLDSATEKNTQFSFIYDLYKQTPIDFSLPFTNVFNNNQMLSYDFLAQNILAWDAGRAIAYPIVAN